jgi:hypothetical protein
MVRYEARPILGQILKRLLHVIILARGSSWPERQPHLSFANSNLDASFLHLVDIAPHRNEFSHLIVAHSCVSYNYFLNVTPC